MAEKSYNKMILELLGTKPIAFNPVLAQICGSANGGLFLSQLLYWWGKGENEGSIYKTSKEVEEETMLSRREQDTVIKKWKQLGVLKVDLKGKNYKRHFKIDTDKLIGLLKRSPAQKRQGDLHKNAKVFYKTENT